MDKASKYKSFTLIEPSKSNAQYWQEVWYYRYLVFYIAIQKIMVRYKQTVLGIFWALLNPFITMVVLSIMFGKFAKFPSEEGIPYPILVFSGVMSWQLFTSHFSTTASSLRSNVNLIKQIYFPRIVLSLSTALVHLIDFALAAIILLGLMIYFHTIPDWHILFYPFFIFLAIIIALGPGLILSCLSVKYKDFRFLVPTLLQLGHLITPVGYTSHLIPEKWKFLYSLNPMVAVIEGSRWSLFRGETSIYLPGLFMSVTMAIVFLTLGVYYLQNTEKNVADYI